MKTKWTMPKFHLYAGLTAAGFLIMLGLSGAILAFDQEIDRALNPQLSFVQPQERKQTMAALIASAEKTYPGYHAVDVWLPEKENLSLKLAMENGKRHEGFLASVDPYTGRVLGDSRNANNLMFLIRRFHSSLLLGPVGGALVYLSAVLMLGLSITGILMWWKRKRFAASSNTPAVVFNLDLHSSIGVYLLALLFVFTFTSLRPVPALGFYDQQKLNAATSTKLPAGATVMTVEQLLEAGQKALPLARAVHVEVPSATSGAVTIIYRYPEDHSRNGKSSIVVNTVTGETLFVLDTRQISALAQYSYVWNMQIHQGLIYGRPSQIFAAIASLLMPLLAITGLRLWWVRKKNAA